MKSLIKFIGLIVMSSLLFLGCEKTPGGTGAGNVNGNGAGGNKPTHPMTYILDLADSDMPTEIEFSDNSEWGNKGESTRQVLVNFTSFVKPNIPQINDKINITGKITSPVDIDKLLVSIVDSSALAGYWTLLGTTDDQNNVVYLEGIKAGVPFELNITFKVAKEIKGNLKVQLAYGEQNGDIVKFTVDRLKKSFIGDNLELARKTPKTWDIDLNKFIEKVELKPDYPWFDGVQDTTADPLSYQGVVDITAFFPEYDFPIKGDKINFTLKSKSDIDVDAFYVRAIENTEVVKWWKELEELPEENGREIGSDIKANNVETFKWTSELTDGIIDGISLCFLCPLDAASKPATFTSVK